MADNVKILLTSVDKTLLTTDDGTTYTIHQMDMGSGPDLVEHCEEQVHLVYAEGGQDSNIIEALPQRSNDSVMPKGAILLLISLMPDYIAKKAARRMKMKEVWSLISKEFELHGYHYPVNQIRNKWRVLERAYKKLTLPRKNGRARTSCPFQCELDAAYAKNPNIMPSMMVSPCDDQPSEDQSDDEGTADFVYEEPIWSTPAAPAVQETPKFKSPSISRPGNGPRVMNRPYPQLSKDYDAPMRFNSIKRKQKAETAISELVELRRQMADNFAKKREESQKRHDEKMALLRELISKVSS